MGEMASGHRLSNHVENHGKFVAWTVSKVTIDRHTGTSNHWVHLFVPARAAVLPILFHSPCCPKVLVFYN